MRVRIISVLASLALPAAAAAQPTAFAYQGRLKNGTTLAVGLHDFRFTLFNVASGGVQLVPPVCVDDILVTDGLFTTTLDFGQQFATTSPLFLQIEVRADTGLNCSNPVGLILLGPRQPLTAAPIATHAKTAFSLAAADGSPTDAVLVGNTGNIGIGTAAPTHTVHIASTAPTLAIQDTDSQQVGYISYRNSGNTETAWIGYGTSNDPDFSVVNARSGGDIVLLPFSGNVGIGTSAPAAKLDVRGDVKLGATGQLFAPGGEENLRIVRGTVSSDGVRIAGSGFSVSHPGLGDYNIVFDAPFAFRPSVTATCEFTSGFVSGTAATDVVGAGQFNIVITIPDVGLVNREFSFIAVGPR